MNEERVAYKDIDEMTDDEKQMYLSRALFETAAYEVLKQFSDARLAALSELSATSLLQIAMAHFREAYNRHVSGDDLRETNHIVREGVGAALVACGVTQNTTAGDEPELVLQKTTSERVEAVYARALEFANEIVDDNQADSLEEIGAIAYLELAISRLRWVASQMTDNSRFSPVDHLLMAMDAIASTVVRYEEGRL